MKKILQYSIKYIYLIMMAAIFISVLFFYKFSLFILAQRFLFSVLVCMLIAFLFFLLLTLLFAKLTNSFGNISAFFVHHSKKLIFIATLVLFLTQVFVTWSSYFLTSWDVGELIKNAYNISNDATDNLNNLYFSRCPNNLLIVSIFVTIFDFAKLIGIDSMVNGVFLIIVLQCFISSLSGLLVFKTVMNITHRTFFSWVSWILFIFLAGSSPWIMIPYSDSMTLIFPILIVWLYSTLDTKKYIIAKWTTIAALSYVGYLLKPQVIITLIAIIIVQFLFTKFTKDCIKQLLQCAIPMSVTVVILSFMLSAYTERLPFQLDKNLEFGMTHYLMLGTNANSNGQFSADDVLYSLSFPTTEERTTANIKEYKKRVKDLGFIGYTRLMAIKTSSNYANGVFGWGQEGGQYFFDKKLKDKNALSPILKETFYLEGKYYKTFAITKQIIWFGILILCFFSLMGKPKKQLLTVALAIIGLTIFEAVFEARARYIFAYVPLYIVLASVGWNNIVTLISEGHPLKAFCNLWKKSSDTNH